MEEIRIKSFRSLIEAEAAQNLLKENKIKSFIKRNEVLAAYAGTNGGADLFVTSKDDYLKSVEIIGKN